MSRSSTWQLCCYPNLLMFRPADAVETAECWQQALKEQHRPSGLALTRQNLAPSRLTYSAENLSAKGAYELIAADNAKVSIFASGSEVELAVKAAGETQRQGHCDPRRFGSLL